MQDQLRNREAVLSPRRHQSASHRGFGNALSLADSSRVLSVHAILIWLYPGVSSLGLVQPTHRAKIVPLVSDNIT
ncbi:hypothetical protein Micbo1qcDRAFT_164358 [Microdochium bolleyi]|uniref:Uncharacterized protein n=1 Tax=Microdochium bolleyi TaxID=196109 RepID=A0A136J0Y1_9PEZI|nr:hypothetical protein Micbo1qcDRAFT_164358 [Microdochium bolleyi]